MAEQAGPSGDAMPAAVRGARAGLAARGDAAAGADQVLAGAVRDARAAVLAVHRRLDAIDAELTDWITAPVDTAPGARELQRFLLTKHRELIAIVAAARDDAAARRAVLDSLRGSYRGSAGPLAQ